MRLTSGARFPCAFGWFIDEGRGRPVISHAGITGTEYARYPDDAMTMVVRTNPGRFIGPGS